MLTVGEASARILNKIQPLDAESLPLERVAGRVLAEKVMARTTSPPWDNSSMDGYAVRSSDLVLADRAGRSPASAADIAQRRSLKVVATIAAGQHAIRPLGAGEAMRIMTGAPIPVGADGVIRIEDTDGGAERVTVNNLRDLGRNIRRAGEDFKVGDTLFEKGAEIGAAHLGVFASAAVSEVSVYRQPRVAVLSSGDELVELGDYSLDEPGARIISANSWTLRELIHDAGGEAIDLGIAADTPASLREKLERAQQERCDLIITSAGVSVGDLDHVRSVFAEMGGELDFWRVRMRPGAPMAFGTLAGIPWLGFSGNPVSAMVSFEVFARPVVRKMMGHEKLHRALIPVRLAEPVEIAAQLTHFLRAILSRSDDGGYVARLAGSQSSAVLTAMARANALLVVPPDRASNPVGALLDALPLTDDLGMSSDFRIQ
jgi:molybdopterin molybdotransferase